MEQPGYESVTKYWQRYPVLYLSVDPGKGFGPKPKFEFYLIPTSLADPVRLSGAFLNPCIRDG
jgi:hypothetical protein